MKRILSNCFVLATIAACFATAHAQSSNRFVVVSSTIDGGGGKSSNARFAIQGSMGQPDAGTHRNGRFKLTGGFWSGITLAQSAEAPELKISLQPGGNVVISWPVVYGGYSLQYTSSLKGDDWTNEPGLIVDTATEHTLTLSPSGNRCYRLVKN